MPLLSILQFAAGPFARVRDRMAGNLKVHFDECRMVGQRSEPVIRLSGMWVENTTGQDAFVEDVDVNLNEPVRLGTRETQWRERDKAVVIDRGGNVPAHQRTHRAYVLVHLDGDLRAPKGHFSGEVVALGREGFRRRPTPIDGDYDIRDL